MGDHFQNLPMPDVLAIDAPKKAEIVRDYLTERDIISTRQTPCVLGNDAGYPPGQRYVDVCQYAFHDDFRFHELLTNGLEIVTKRNVYHFGQDQLRLACRLCNSSLTKIESAARDFIECISTWYETGTPPEFRCPICTASRSMVDWQRNANIMVSEFALVFWNWPPLKPAFLDRISRLVGQPVFLIAGKL